MRLAVSLLMTMSVLAVPAFAQSGLKPGQRALTDDRVPEAPQLQKKIFKEPKIIYTKPDDKKEEKSSPFPEKRVKQPEDKAESRNNANVDININTNDIDSIDVDDVADKVKEIQDEIDKANR